MTTSTRQRTDESTKSTESYAALLQRARSLFARDVETRFEMAELFGKMLKHKTAAEVAEDTDMTPGGVARIAQVAEFWGKVRIKPDGKRSAPWFVYDRVALDLVIPPEKKELIRRAAPVQGLAVVRQMIDAARRPELSRVEAIARSKRASTPTMSKATPPRGQRPATPSSELDGSVFVTGAVRSLDSAVASLDKLESLSDADAETIRARVNDVVAHVVRLTTR